MNRPLLLFVLLFTFLGCGNSELDVPSTRPAGRSPLPPPLSREEQVIAGRLEDFFSELHRQGAFNGSVLVARAGRILYQKSLGWLDKKEQLPLTDSSQFQLASVSKVITATAVLLLHERGKLDIFAPMRDYFPDFPYQGVTVKDLLTHRSGLPNYIYCLNAEICQPNYRMNNSDMYESLVAKNVKAYHKPDKRFYYCNTNYAMLALLIEKVSGKSYPDFLREELFLPLGMKRTATILEIDLEGPNTTRPYDNRWKPVPFDASDFVLGDKSIYSTAYDLFLFSEALYQNRIIRPETQELAYTAFSKEQKLSNYGFGWRLKDYQVAEKKEVYHNGWWHGYRSAFHRRLHDTLTVVVLSNQLNRTAYQTQKVYEILDQAPAAADDTEDEN